nr:hypothetical transcript [Hymenolepis microstoma]
MRTTLRLTCNQAVLPSSRHVCHKLRRYHISVEIIFESHEPPFILVQHHSKSTGHNGAINLMTLECNFIGLGPTIYTLSVTRKVVFVYHNSILCNQYIKDIL